MAKKKQDATLLAQGTFGAFMERELQSSGPVWRYGRWDLWREFIAWLLAVLQEDEGTRLAIERRKLDAVDTWRRWTQALVEANRTRPCVDHLGAAYMLLGMGSDGFGQYFTPDHVAELLARTNLCNPTDVAPDRLAHGIEPTAGSGVMVLAAERVRIQEGLPPIIWTAIDLDPVVAQMAAIQFCLNDIPAVVLCGDSLRWGMAEDCLRMKLISPRIRYEEDGRLVQLEEVTEGQAARIRREMESHVLEVLSARAGQSAEDKEIA